MGPDRGYWSGLTQKQVTETQFKPAGAKGTLWLINCEAKEGFALGAAVSMWQGSVPFFTSCLCLALVLPHQRCKGPGKCQGKEDSSPHVHRSAYRRPADTAVTSHRPRTKRCGPKKPGGCPPPHVRERLGPEWADRGAPTVTRRGRVWASKVSRPQPHSELYLDPHSLRRPSDPFHPQIHLLLLVNLTEDDLCPL